MLSFLLGLIPGALNTVNGITNAIANEKIAGLNSKTDQERIASEERVNTLQARRDVLIEDAKHSKLDLIIRSIIGGSVAYIIAKLLVYDKTFDATTLMSPDLWNVVYIALGFYFLSSTASFFRR